MEVMSCLVFMSLTHSAPACETFSCCFVLPVLHSVIFTYRSLHTAAALMEIYEAEPHWTICNTSNCDYPN